MNGKDCMSRWQRWYWRILVLLVALMPGAALAHAKWFTVARAYPLRLELLWS